MLLVPAFSRRSLPRVRVDMSCRYYFPNLEVCYAGVSNTAMITSPTSTRVGGVSCSNGGVQKGRITAPLHPEE